MTAAAPRVPLPPEFVRELAAAFGPRFTTSAAECLQHGRDESSYAPMPPDAVLYVTSTDDVSRAVRLCAAHRVPVIPFGVGSSVEGHLLAVRGGLSIDLSRMDQVLAVRPQDLSATAQAGCTREALNAALRGTGLFFSVDPGANAGLAAWSRPPPPARTPCATGPCATTCWH